MTPASRVCDHRSSPKQAPELNSSIPNVFRNAEFMSIFPVPVALKWQSPSDQAAHYGTGLWAMHAGESATPGTTHVDSCHTARRKTESDLALISGSTTAARNA